MISLGLRRSEYRRYLRLLHRPHWIKINVHLLTTEEKYIRNLSRRLLDGQVDIDAKADITRSCKVTILDPEAQVNLDTESPFDGALFMDRMIAVVYTVIDPEDLDFSVDIPIFRGPITKLDRTHDVINIEAQGKEVLSMSMAWKAKTFKKGTPKSDVIERILRQLAGERRISMRSSRPRLPKDYSTNRETIPWKAASRFARNLQDQLFYDGRGFARLRNLPTKSVYTFRSGPNGVLKSHPEASYDLGDMRNVVWVQGKAKSKGKGKNKKERTINAVVAAKRKHPLSPWRLGRNGVPQRFVEKIEDDSIRTKKAAKRKARQVLRNRMVETVDVKFDCLPVPHLEELDRVRVRTPEFAATFRIKQMSIPLLASGSMTVGYNRRLSPKAVRIRRRNRRRPRKRNNRNRRRARRR